MRRQQADTETPAREDSVDATAWFAVLLHARDNYEFEEAAEARAELRRLGVDVRFRREAGAEVSRVS